MIWMHFWNVLFIILTCFHFLLQLSCSAVPWFLTDHLSVLKIKSVFIFKIYMFVGCFVFTLGAHVSSKHAASTKWFCHCVSVKSKPILLLFFFFLILKDQQGNKIQHSECFYCRTSISLSFSEWKWAFYFFPRQMFYTLINLQNWPCCFVGKAPGITICWRCGKENPYLHHSLNNTKFRSL